MNSHEALQDALILVSCALVAVGLSLRTVSGARLWRATITPLASIIGSGFLVSGPLLASIAGPYAVFLMAALCLAGYMIGSAVRHNIRHLEPVMREPDGEARLKLLAGERLSELCLAIAYLISISFYIQLLAAFVLRGANLDNPFLANILATCILAFLGVVGFVRGFRNLEQLEELAVTIKLTVIAGLLAGLLGYNFELLEQGQWQFSQAPGTFDMKSLRIALGALLIVQGFETSRYLGHVYSCDERVRSMRLAQLLASAIYVAFMVLVAAFLDPSVPAKETAIIDYSATVAAILPILLILGAAAAQFSAAIADFVGSAGLAAGVFPVVRERWLYPAIAVTVIALTWMTNVFEILTIASRAFAAYYLLQSLLALLAWKVTGKGRPTILQSIQFSLGAIASAATLLFGLPAH
ncbi:MAG: hypothetical protein Kow0032_26340 [Methyloligellaceae bacterium]